MPKIYFPIFVFFSTGDLGTIVEATFVELFVNSIRDLFFSFILREIMSNDLRRSCVLLCFFLFQKCWTGFPLRSKGSYFVEKRLGKKTALIRQSVTVVLLKFLT